MLSTWPGATHRGLVRPHRLFDDFGVTPFLPGAALAVHNATMGARSQQPAVRRSKASSPEACDCIWLKS